jgi:hypothetical protein
MFVSSPELGEDHCWEGVRNGVYCIWMEGNEERWEIYDPTSLYLVKRRTIEELVDPALSYELVTRQAIESLRQLTMASFDVSEDVQREKYSLAVSAYEIWSSKVGGAAIAQDRSYLEMIIDQNPIAYRDEAHAG